MTLRTIEAIASISSDGTLTARVPADIPPGEHRVVVVVEDTAAEPAGRPASPHRSTSEVGATPSAQPRPPREQGPFGIRVYDVGAWPQGLSLRREDLYGDWER